MRSTADGELAYARSLPSVHCRVLSVAWQPGDAGLFVGGVDGVIRHVDAKTGHSAFRMTVESRNNLDPSMVWTLKVRALGLVTMALPSTLLGLSLPPPRALDAPMLWQHRTQCLGNRAEWQSPVCAQVLSDGTLMSGDSTGSVHFWDGHMGALTQSFTVHEVRG
jgi:WD40 repeat protein